MASRPATRSYSAFTLDGQHYERIAEDAHKTQRNTIAVITTWRSNCADCDAEFTFTSPQKPGPFGPTRRCKACVSPTGKHKPVGSLATRRRNPTGVAIDCHPEIPALVAHEVMALAVASVTRASASRRSDPHPRAPAATDVFTDR